MTKKDYSGTFDPSGTFKDGMKIERVREEKYKICYDYMVCSVCNRCCGNTKESELQHKIQSIRWNVIPHKYKPKKSLGYVTQYKDEDESKKIGIDQLKDLTFTEMLKAYLKVVKDGNQVTAILRTSIEEVKLK